jgi:hypothetical protein
MHKILLERGPRWAVRTRPMDRIASLENFGPNGWWCGRGGGQGGGSDCWRRMMRRRGKQSSLKIAAVRHVAPGGDHVFSWYKQYFVACAKRLVSNVFPVCYKPQRCTCSRLQRGRAMRASCSHIVLHFLSNIIEQNKNVSVVRRGFFFCMCGRFVKSQFRSHVWPASYRKQNTALGSQLYIRCIFCTIRCNKEKFCSYTEQIRRKFATLYSFISGPLQVPSISIKRNQNHSRTSIIQKLQIPPALSFSPRMSSPALQATETWYLQPSVLAMLQKRKSIKRSARGVKKLSYH